MDVYFISRSNLLRVIRVCILRRANCNELKYQTKPKRKTNYRFKLEISWMRKQSWILIQDILVKTAHGITIAFIINLNKYSFNTIFPTNMYYSITKILFSIPTNVFIF